VDTVRAVARVLAPLVAQGPIIRRPVMTWAAGRFGWDAGAIDVLADLRARYDGGPVLLRVPGRDVGLVLRREDVGRALRDSPQPFAASTVDKRAALGHFQTNGVLISTGEVRQRRRAFNEQVLDTGHVMHRLAESITSIVEQEVDALLRGGRRVLEWSDFSGMFGRVVRRIVLGDRAAGDRGVNAALDRLRRRANWAYAAPHARLEMKQFHSRLAQYLAAGAPGSLAAAIAATPAEADVDPYGQVPHWLFAFDALGATVFRALVALGADRSAMSAVEGERWPGVAYRPRLAAVVLDTLRLWPTTLVLLRETTQPTPWPHVQLPTRTTLIVVSSFFHRDAGHIPAAHRLNVDSWLDGTFDRDPGIVPFSAGPVRCPGRDLVVFTGATLLASLLSRHDVAGVTPALDPQHLPIALDHFRIAVELGPRR
jgi:cytochrome P450